MTLATPAGETAPGPSVPRRWRPRRLDVVLVVVGTIMAIATGAEIASIYQLRGRGPEDARALAAYTARLTPGARYGLAKVSSAIKGFDVICADLLTPAGETCRFGGTGGRPARSRPSPTTTPAGGVR